MDLEHLALFLDRDANPTVKQLQYILAAYQEAFPDEDTQQRCEFLRVRLNALLPGLPGPFDSPPEP